MAGRFVDFYALLDIAPDSSPDVVQAAVTEQRKSWEAQRADGDDTVRADADARLGDIDLAELVLLDPENRAGYDEEWREQRGNGVAQAAAATNGKAPVAVAPVVIQSRTAKKATADQEEATTAEETAAEPGEKPATGPSGRLAADSGQATAGDTAAEPGQAPSAKTATGSAGKAAATGPSGTPAADPGQATTGNTAAQPGGKATAEPGGKARSASDDDSVAQARQAMQAGDTSRAIDSYHYAIMLQPQDVELHHELGQAYVTAGNYEQALGAFESAARIAPHVGDYRAAIGDALIHLARPGDAIGVLEQVVAEAPMEPRYRATLAQALHDTCVHEMTLLSDGLVCITTAEQAQLVERLTGRALTLLDPTDTSELAQDIREKHELARLAPKRVWRPPFPWWMMIAFAVVVAAGFALFVTWWSAFIVLAVLTAVGYLLGIHPTWWHVAREARAANLLIWPQPHGGSFPAPPADPGKASPPPQ